MAPAAKKSARSKTAPAAKAPSSELQAAAQKWAGLDRSTRHGLLESLGNSVCDNPRTAANQGFDELVDHVRAELARRL